MTSIKEYEIKEGENSLKISLERILCFYHNEKKNIFKVSAIINSENPEREIEFFMVSEGDIPAAHYTLLATLKVTANESHKMYHLLQKSMQTKILKLPPNQNIIQPNDKN